MQESERTRRNLATNFPDVIESIEYLVVFDDELRSREMRSDVGTPVDGGCFSPLSSGKSSQWRGSGLR